MAFNIFKTIYEIDNLKENLIQKVFIWNFLTMKKNEKILLKVQAGDSIT